MFDKIKTVEEYRKSFNFSLIELVEILSNNDRNLIMINCNSGYIRDKIYNELKLHNFNICIPTCLDIQNSFSLGGFLRKKIDSDQLKQELLILDFTKQLKYLYDDSTDLVNDININRDLFTLAYNSVIIIAQQPEYYRIQKYAYDFKTCVNFYFDATKWFCSILPLPIIDLPSPISISKQILNLYSDRSESNKKYVEILNKINSIKVYNSVDFFDIYSEINNINDRSIYYLSTYLFVDKIINAKNTPESFMKKKKDLFEISYNIDLNAEICIYTLIKLAKFYYNACEYDIAKKFFETALYPIINCWKYENKEYVVSFIECNIIVCEYMSNRSHEPYELLKKIEQKLSINKYKKPQNIIDFETSYNLIINEALFHHSFLQHKDIFRKINNLKSVENNLFSIEEALHISYIWERFITNDFQVIPMYSNSKSTFDAPISKIHHTIHYMINMFINEDYTMAKKYYKKADYLARSYGFINISRLLHIINNNMFFLRSNNSPLKY